MSDFKLKHRCWMLFIIICKGTISNTCEATYRKMSYLWELHKVPCKTC